MEEKLIEKVRMHEVLYNIRLSHYRDHQKRKEAWQEIGKDMKMTADTVKGNWDKLRRCYLNALHRRRSKKGEAASKKILPWKFESQMSFLLPFLGTRKSSVTDNDSTQYAYNDDEIDNDTQFENSQIEISKDQEFERSLSEDFKISTAQNKSAADKNDGAAHRLQIIKRKKREGPVISIHEKVNTSKDSTLQRKRKFEERPTNTSTLDETDMFFMSMSKMTKQLPFIEQTKIKLQLSQAVLQAQLRISTNQQHYNQHQERPSSAYSDAPSPSTNCSAYSPQLPGD